MPSILDFVMLAASRGQKPSDRTGGEGNRLDALTTRILVSAYGGTGMITIRTGQLITHTMAAGS